MQSVRERRGRGESESSWYITYVPLRDCEQPCARVVDEVEVKAGVSFVSRKVRSGRRNVQTLIEDKGYGAARTTSFMDGGNGKSQQVKSSPG